MLVAASKSSERYLLSRSIGQDQDQDLEASSEVDSGSYHTLDLTEVDDVEELEDDDIPGEFKRPKGVSERDWKVYEVVNAVVKEFEPKFKAMWA